MPDSSPRGRLVAYPSTKSVLARVARLGVLLLCALLVGDLVGGCVSLDAPAARRGDPVADCQIACESSCPSGLVCISGMCMRSASDAPCAGTGGFSSEGGGFPNVSTTTGGGGGTGTGSATGGGTANGGGGTGTGGGGTANGGTGGGPGMGGGGAGGDAGPDSGGALNDPLLAYTSSESGASLLYLFNASTEGKQSFPGKSFTKPSVTSFQFSPDGNYLAFQASIDGKPAQLFLLTAPDWNEQLLPIDGAVQHYTWSPDSRAIAVSYKVGSETYLGGVRVTRDADAGSTAAETDGGEIAVPLAPVAVAINTAAVWFQGNHIAFGVPSTSTPTFDSICSAALGANQFSVTVVDDDTPYVPSVEFQGSDQGFFAIDTEAQGITFYGGNGGTGFSNPLRTGVVDPSGLLLGVASDPDLLIFLATIDGGGSVSSAMSTMGCASLGAWANNDERVVCVAADGAVNLFNVGGQSASLNPIPIPNVDTSEGDYTNRRRALSPSGSWLALTTESKLFVVDLRSGIPALQRTDNPWVGPSIAANSDLAFSPDEKRLLWQYGSKATIHDLLNKVWSPRLLDDDDLAPAVACNEAFVTAPTNWCGSTLNNPKFVWSPDSRFAAVKSANGSIETMDLLDEDMIQNSKPCTSECGNTLVYRPRQQ